MHLTLPNGSGSININVMTACKQRDMIHTWLTVVAIPTAAAEQTHCEQQPRDFVHLTVVTTALHNSAQNNTHTVTLCSDNSSAQQQTTVNIMYRRCATLSTVTIALYSNTQW